MNSNKSIRQLKQVKGKIRGDMYQPKAFLTLSIICIAAGLACLWATVTNFGIYNLTVTAAALIYGIYTFLYWKNNKIVIRSKTEFEYTDTWGRKKIYKFNRIKGLDKSRTPAKLIVGNDRITVGKNAVMTEELIRRIDKAMEANRK